MISKEKTKLIIKICNLYYIENLNQREIADRTGIERSQVSRLLSAAKTEGIVSFLIKDPFSNEHKYEKAIVQKYGILDAVVIDTLDLEQPEINHQLALETTVLLDAIIKDNHVLGVMAGSTINFLSEHIGHIEPKGLRVVPLVGGWGLENNSVQANINTKNFGERFKCTFYQLNAPAYVASKELRDALLIEPSISSVLKIAKNADIALVTIGQVSVKELIIESGPLAVDDIKELISKGAVASFCGSFLNEKGDCVDFSGSERLIGLEAKDLKNVRRVIAVASGKNKASAINAALRGKWIDILVTNLQTAKEILAIK